MLLNKDIHRLKMVAPKSYLTFRRSHFGFPDLPSSEYLTQILSQSASSSWNKNLDICVLRVQLTIIIWGRFCGLLFNFFFKKTLLILQQQLFWFFIEEMWKNSWTEIYILHENEAKGLVENLKTSMTMINFIAYSKDQKNHHDFNTFTL